jgi:hypothetical protein
MYGLVVPGDTRRVRLSKDALDYFRDERENTRQRMLQSFATKPPLLQSLWGMWGAKPPADTIARSHLKIERQLNEQSTRSLLSIYKDNLAFAKLTDGAKVRELEGGEDGSDIRWPIAKVGDFVQWTSGGVEQFRPARRVTWVSEDGEHLRVHGSMTGIPMAEAIVVDPPAPPTTHHASAHISGAAGIGATGTVTAGSAAAPQANRNTIDAYLTGRRLQISADLDGEGIAQLKQVLSKYEEILKLLKTTG